MIQILLLKKILQLVLIALMGYVLVKCRVIESCDSVILSKISLYLILPCAIINSFQVEYDAGVIRGLLAATLAAFIIHVVLVAVMGIIGKKANLTTVEQTSVIYSNAANLVIPLVTYVLGDEWVIYSTAFMTVQLIFIWSHCISLFQGKNRIQSKSILLNINFIAIIVGLFLMICRIRLPDIAGDVLESVGSMMGAVAMLIIGILAGGMDMKRVFCCRRLYLIAVLRLVAVPFVLLLVLKGFMAAGVIETGSYLFLIVFLAAITPTASTITQFAQVYGGDAEYAGAINLATTIGCIVTMPLMVWAYFL